MRTPECTIAVPMSNREKRLIEDLSKKSKVKCGEMLHILLFETGILADAGNEELRNL